MKKDLLFFINVLSSPSDASAGWQNWRTVAPTPVFHIRIRRFCLIGDFVLLPKFQMQCHLYLNYPEGTICENKEIGWEWPDWRSREDSHVMQALRGST
jgi:hypothetical protein